MALNALDNHLLMNFMQWLGKSTYQGACLVCLILLIQCLFNKKLRARWRYGLWILLFIRLMLPWAPSSRLSIFNVMPGMSTVSGLFGHSQLGEWVIGTWLVGVLFLLGTTGISCARLWWIVKHQRPVTDSKILNLLEDCKERLGVQVILGIVESERIKGPALFGFIRPRLLVPQGMLQNLSPDQLGHIFLHELAHLKRHDIFWSWLGGLLKALHWFNPLVWLACLRSRADREIACDQLVMTALPRSEIQLYGKTVLKLLQQASTTSYHIATAGILEHKADIERRINMIAGYSKEPCKHSWLAWLGMMVLGCMVLTNAMPGLAGYGVSQPTATRYSGGHGTTDDPYRISCVHDLITLGNTTGDYNRCFILTRDLDLDPNLSDGQVFDRAVIAPDTDDVEPDFQGKPFSGSFDGQGHAIRHLCIQGGSCVGLFGYIYKGAAILNLGLQDVDIQGQGDFAGGLVGKLCDSSIACTFSTGVVTGDNGVGALAGFSERSQIVNCYSLGLVAGHKQVGGLIGKDERSSVSNCYSTSVVTGDAQVGGLMGSNYQGCISNSFWDIELSGLPTSAGGVGVTTARMQDVDVFLTAGWDAADEIDNGTCDYWLLSPGDTPRLRYERGLDYLMPEGLGTTQRPYLIRNARDLGTVWRNPYAYYRLESSVDLGTKTWSAALIPWFGGTLDGNGHTISNVRIQGGGHLGLLACLGPDGIISNVNLEAVDVNGTGRYVGSLAGRSFGSVSDCRIVGQVTGGYYVGGLLGFINKYGTVFNSASHSSVTGSRHIGGLVGYNNKGSISYCHSTSSVTGDYYVGGLVGGNGWKGTVSDSYSIGDVVGNHLVGGLVGENHWHGIIETSYSAGTVAGQSKVGGLLGDNRDGSVSNSYSTSAVTGEDFVGGLVGINGEGVISHSYSTGRVTGKELVGGLVGSNVSDKGINGDIINSFWDIESSGVRGGRRMRTGGLTTTELQDRNTFLNAGWDMVNETINGLEDLWFLPAGDYPHLTWETQ